MGIIDSSINEQPAAAQTFSMTGLDGKPLTVTEDELAKMDWSTLLQLRKVNEKNGDLQAVLAPFEHRAYARESVAENPLMAASIGVATPAYALAKGLGLIGSRSGGSSPFTQMAAGFRGIGEGLSAAAKK